MMMQDLELMAGGLENIDPPNERFHRWLDAYYEQNLEAELRKLLKQEDHTAYPGGVR